MKIARPIALAAWLLSACAPGVSDLAPRATPSDSIVAAEVDASAAREAVADIPPPLAIPATRLSTFGAISTDAEGRLSIRRTREIFNAANELYGWLIWVGPSSEVVHWTETLTGPPAAGDAAPPPDPRKTVFSGAMVPDQGFIHSQWMLGHDEAPGDYALEVALPGGRTERFSFALGPPRDACPAMKVLLNWWRADEPGLGDLERRDVTERVMTVFGMRLARHGFASAALDDAYWYVIASAARRSDDPAIAYGHIVMRAIADFQGKARRYSAATSRFSGTIDYGVLFESSAGRLDAFVRELADQFAAKLSPHARQACFDWWNGQWEEEARLEAIRALLEEEIARVRERRAEYQKQLDLEVEVDE